MLLLKMSKCAQVEEQVDSRATAEQVSNYRKHINHSVPHLRDSGVGTVGANDEVELIGVLDALVGPFRVPREVDLVLSAILIRGDVNLRHQPVDSVRALMAKRNVVGTL